jgi:hypothetical protein
VLSSTFTQLTEEPLYKSNVFGVSESIEEIGIESFEIE